MRQFTDAETAFDTHQYPTTARKLVEEYGDMILDLPNGEETVGQALSIYGDEPFLDAESATMALYGGVSDKAIGRKFYSDRCAPTMGEEGPETVSF